MTARLTNAELAAFEHHPDPQVRRLAVECALVKLVFDRLCVDLASLANQLQRTQPNLARRLGTMPARAADRAMADLEASGALRPKGDPQ